MLTLAPPLSEPFSIAPFADKLEEVLEGKYAIKTLVSF